MAFDLHTSETSESIGHHEDFLFLLVDEQPDRYPQLNGLWDKFYDSPILYPHQAETIVHELIDLLNVQGGLDNKALSHLIFRLLYFFSVAAKKDQSIQCSSD